VRRFWSVRISIVFISVGTFFLDLFCGGIVSCFSTETHWAPMLGGGGLKNRRESPNTRITGFNVQSSKHKETKNLQKTALASKVVNPFTRAREPPFIGRQRDFLHSENTLESKEYS
jgi:hypothetical protein